MDNFLNIGIDTILQLVAIIVGSILGLAVDSFRKLTNVRITEDQRRAIQAVIMRGIESALRRNPTMSRQDAAAAGVGYAKRTSPELYKKVTKGLNNAEIAVQEAAEGFVDQVKDLLS